MARSFFNKSKKVFLSVSLLMSLFLGVFALPFYIVFADEFSDDLLSGSWYAGYYTSNGLSYGTSDTWTSLIENSSVGLYNFAIENGFISSNTDPIDFRSEYNLKFSPILDLASSGEYLLNILHFTDGYDSDPAHYFVFVLVKSYFPFIPSNPLLTDSYFSGYDRSYTFLENGYLFSYGPSFTFDGSINTGRPSYSTISKDSFNNLSYSITPPDYCFCIYFPFRILNGSLDLLSLNPSSYLGAIYGTYSDVATNFNACFFSIFQSWTPRFYSDPILFSTFPMFYQSNVGDVGQEFSFNTYSGIISYISKGGEYDYYTPYVLRDAPYSTPTPLPFQPSPSPIPTVLPTISPTPLPLAYDTDVSGTNDALGYLATLGDYFTNILSTWTVIPLLATTLGYVFHYSPWFGVALLVPTIALLSLLIGRNKS